VPVSYLECVEFQCHEQIALAWLVAGERAAQDEARALVERPGRGKCRRRPGLQAHPAETPDAGYLEQVSQQGPPDSAPSRGLGGVVEEDAGTSVAARPTP
jgi:hypothetical protein